MGQIEENSREVEREDSLKTMNMMVQSNRCKTLPTMSHIKHCQSCPGT